MLYIDLKETLRDALTNNDKVEIINIFRMMQTTVPAPKMINECADVARAHLTSLTAGYCKNIPYYISEQERSLGDFAAYCILYAHDVSVECQNELNIARQNANNKNPRDLINELKDISKWARFCKYYFEGRIKYISGLRKCKPILEVSIIHHMMDVVMNKGYLRHISRNSSPLRIVVLPYRRNGENSTYLPDENLICVLTPRKSKDTGDPRFIFLHEIGHSVHNQIIYNPARNLVKSYLPIHDMLFNNLLQSEKDFYDYADIFADCFSLAVSIGDDGLYNTNPFSKIFDAFTVQILDYYFQELSNCSSLVEADSDEFWKKERREKLSKFLCDYDLDRSEDRYCDIVYRLGRAIRIQLERNEGMNTAEMLYECLRAINIHHHIPFDPLPFPEAIEKIKKIKLQDVT
jgi:hypothetical protein